MTEEREKYLLGLVRGNACAICGDLALSVIPTMAASGEAEYIVYCQICAVRNPSLAYDPDALAAYRRGDPQTENERVSAERMLARIARREGMTTKDLAIRREDLVPSNQALVTKLKARFPKDLADPAAMEQLLYVARELDLNIFMGEIIPYQGSPYIPIKGLVRKARESGTYAGLQTRPATRDERQDALVPENDHCWTALVTLTDGSKYQGWGKVTQAEINAKGSSGGFRNPVLHNKPAEMAESRAVHDALERAGVLHLAPVAQELMVRVINGVTGEILEEEPAQAALPEPAWTEYPDEEPVATALEEEPAQGMPGDVESEPVETEPPVTPAQVRAIEAGVKRLKWTEGELQGHIALNFGGAKKVSELTLGQANRLYDWLCMDGKPVMG